MRVARRRPRRLGPAAAVITVVVSVALLVATAALAARVATPAPSAKTPISIKYSGTFDMTNKLKPQGVPSSYTYHLEWVSFWSGRWGQLFPDRARFNSNPTPYAQTTISGIVTITFRERIGGAKLVCGASVIEDPGRPSTFSLSYDTSAGALQAIVAAPTFQGSKLVPKGPNSTKPGCTGGPGVNVFSAPQSFNPLGQGGKVSLRTGGTIRYDRTWEWTHAFASATSTKPTRKYTASINTELAVVLKRS